MDEIFGKSHEKRKRNILVFVENEIQRVRGILIYSRSTETASRAILDENEDEQIIREVHQDTKSVEGRATRRIFGDHGPPHNFRTKKLNTGISVGFHSPLQSLLIGYG